MRSSFEFDPRSALLGAVAVVVALFGLSAMQPAIPASSGGLAVPQPLRVAGLPAGKDMLTVQQGSPLTVPDGRVFVATGIGLSALSQSSDSEGLVSIVADGLTVLVVGLGDSRSTGSLSTQQSASVFQLPQGLTAAAGSEISATTKNGAAVLFGYLEDA
ncbi:MAG: hypothetical protein AAF196_08820 [Planctomycetota bacterium]